MTKEVAIDDNDVDVPAVQPMPVGESHAQTDADGNSPPGRPGRRAGRRDGKPACGARTRNGGTCQNTFIGANGRCRMHNGNAPGGIASAAYRTGRYSRYMPKGLKADYLTALEDSELLSLRDDVALLEARQAELLRKMDSVPQVPWDKVLKATAVLEQAKTSDKPAVAAALRALVELVRAGGSAAAMVAGCWRELREVLQEKARVVQAESKRLDEMHQTMTRTQAVMLMGEVAAAVRDNVTDRAVLQRIQNRLNGVLSEGKVAGASNVISTVPTVPSPTPAPTPAPTDDAPPLYSDAPPAE